MTAGDMRDAWTYALSEIEAAIAFLEVERLEADIAPNNAANSWLAALYRGRTPAGICPNRL